MAALELWKLETFYEINKDQNVVTHKNDVISKGLVTFGAGIIFLIIAHPVYKMWIIQEPNMLELWNKLHFEEEKTESIHHV